MEPGIILPNSIRSSVPGLFRAKLLGWWRVLPGSIGTGLTDLLGHWQVQLLEWVAVAGIGASRCQWAEAEKARKHEEESKKE